MVARTGKPADPGPETVKNGCIYWYGFCQMCPFKPDCLYTLPRRKRQAVIKGYAIRMMVKNNFTTGVIRVCMNVSEATIFRAIKEG